MNKKTSLVNILRNSEGVKALKEASIDFCVFNGDVVDFTKTICRPDDYYAEGDEITFTIKLKNIGEKRIVNFSLKDDLLDVVLPFEDGYKVTTTSGQIGSYNKPVMINHITLMPEEEAVVTITGVIGEVE